MYKESAKKEKLNDVEMEESDGEDEEIKEIEVGQNKRRKAGLGDNESEHSSEQMEDDEEIGGDDDEEDIESMEEEEGAD